MFRRVLWGPDKWPTVLPARMAFGFPIRPVKYVINPPERHTTRFLRVLWFLDRWLFSSNIYKLLLILVFCVGIFRTPSHDSEGGCMRERHLRGSWYHGFWNFGMISYCQIKCPILVGYQMQLKVPNMKPCLLSEEHTSAHTQLRSGILSMKISKTIPFNILLGSYNTTWARNEFLSSLKTLTAGCRNAAESISENTQGIGKQKGRDS